MPEVRWLDYSFQNFDHIVDQPLTIRDGRQVAPDRPGLRLTRSATARNAAMAEPAAGHP